MQADGTWRMGGGLRECWCSALASRWQKPEWGQGCWCLAAAPSGYPCTAPGPSGPSSRAAAASGKATILLVGSWHGVWVGCPIPDPHPITSLPYVHAPSFVLTKQFCCTCPFSIFVAHACTFLLHAWGLVPARTENSSGAFGCPMVLGIRRSAN